MYTTYNTRNRAEATSVTPPYVPQHESESLDASNKTQSMVSMSLRTTLNTAITVILVLLVVAVIASQLFGFPPPISYVGTDSMAPQLEPGDGFVGIPAPLAGDVSEGDVITYRAQILGGGGLTTHRVVEETEEGYITKGDNNPFTDQEGDEPPVTDAQIELVALQIGGQIVKIPFVGQAAELAGAGLGAVVGLLSIDNVGSGNPGVVIGVVGLLLVASSIVYDAVTDDKTRSMKRSVKREGIIDSKLILLAVLLILSLPLLSMTMLPSGTDEMNIVSTTTPQPDDRSLIQAGTSIESTMSIRNGQPVPMVIIVESGSDSLEIYNPVLPAAAGERVETGYRMSAPDETGSYVRARSVSFYIHVLPASVIGFLHGLHPVIALVVTTGVTLSPVAVLFYVLVGFRRISLRDTGR